MDRQAIFDKVASHLLKQKEKSKHIFDSICVYRGKDNLRCAIGCLIPDEVYAKHRGIEGSGAGWLCEQPWFRDLLAVESLEDTLLLCRLQRCHDGMPVELWRTNLSDIAKEFNLDETVLRQGENRRPQE